MFKSLTDRADSLRREYRRERSHQPNSDDDLAALQLCIMADPGIGQVIPGTDGLRKMRFARESENTGKRGGARVLYVHFPEYALGLLVYAYRKGSQDDIDEDDKRFINQQIRRVRQELERRSPLS